eukprot:g2627.t1
MYGQTLGGGYGGYGGGLAGGYGSGSYGGYGGRGMFGGGQLGGGYGGMGAGGNMNGNINPHGQGQQNNNQPVMIPQFSTRAMVRFLMECAAVIQGTALVFVTVNSWLQSQTNATGEAGPLTQLYTIVRDTVMTQILGRPSRSGGGASGSSSSTSHVGIGLEWARDFLRRRRSLEKEFIADTKLSWLQYLLFFYLSYSLVSEFRNYLRLRKLPVKVPRPALPGIRSAKQQQEMMQAGRSAGTSTGAVGSSGVTSTTRVDVERIGSSSLEVEVNHANGDQKIVKQATDFYFRKQQELKQKRENASSGSGRDNT